MNLQHSSTGATPLHAAAGRGRVAEVKQLLLKGADVSVKSLNGMDAIAWAKHFDHEEVRTDVRAVVVFCSTPKQNTGVVKVGLNAHDHTAHVWCLSIVCT